MKKKFRIVRKQYDNEESYYIVQERLFPFIWGKSYYDEFTRSLEGWGETIESYIHFSTIRAVREALLQVKESMKKELQSNNNKTETEVEIVTIEV